MQAVVMSMIWIREKMTIAKTKNAAILCLAISLLTGACASKAKVADLPDDVKRELLDMYPDAKIKKVTVTQHGRDVRYDVELNNYDETIHARVVRAKG